MYGYYVYTGVLIMRYKLVDQNNLVKTETYIWGRKVFITAEYVTAV